MRGQFWSFLQCFFCVRPIFVTLVRTPVDFCPEAHVERQERVEHEVCVEHEARVEREVHVECEACVQLGQVGIWWLIFVTLYFCYYSYPAKCVPSAKEPDNSGLLGTVCTAWEDQGFYRRPILRHHWEKGSVANSALS